jgi:hypothetical protein
MPPHTPRVETRRISQLRPASWWSELLGDLPPNRRAFFDADVAENGVEVRPEILPDGTVISGVIRKGSAGRNRYSTIEVLVRYDLADTPREDIEYRALANELNRRHQTPLGLAKLIYRMCELEIARSMAANGRRWEAAVRAAAKDKIAAFLGITLRSVNLYLKAINAPKVVREACDRKEVTLTKTGRVGELSNSIKTRISRLIRGGASAAVVVNSYLPPPNTTSGGARLRRWSKSEAHHVPLVRGHVRGLTREQVDTYRQELTAAYQLLGRVLAI